MDTVIIDYYRANMMDKSGLENPDQAEYISSPLNVTYFDVDDNLKLSINPKIIEFFKRHAKEHDIKSDHIGRTENRGCPFLKTNNQDVIITFAIDELIGQYKSRQ